MFTSVVDYIITEQAPGYKVNDVRVKRSTECRPNQFLLLAEVLAKNPYMAKMRTEYEGHSKKEKENK
jgi:hypothetical protein